MAANQDARPFVDLQKDADEFRQKFDDDILKCISYLDSKITALICDPDSLGSPSKKNAVKSNALVEFSKAKYDIFIGVKTLVNEMEREWLKYISEMKKLFIENVEIFLAGTKLEVKLPTSEFKSSPEFQQSPRKERSSVVSSIFPMLFLPKNLAVTQEQSYQLKRGAAKVILSKDGPSVSIRGATTSSPKKIVDIEEEDSSDITDDSDEEIGRRASRRGASSEYPAQELSPKKSSLMNAALGSGLSRSPKKVSFIPVYQTSEDLDVFTPSVKSTSSVRRKTLLPSLNEAAEDLENPRSSSKRKTIGGFSNLSDTNPPKRLKVSGSKKSVASSQAEEDTDDDNLLESDGKYSDWIGLKSIDARIPAKPGIYEVKVWRAKKSAYIGHCESLRQKLTLHKLKQNSGHKHLDKFIERNMNDIQIRFESMSSVDVAKTEVKNRVKGFVAQHKTTPAYN